METHLGIVVEGKRNVPKVIKYKKCIIVNKSICDIIKSLQKDV